MTQFNPTTDLPRKGTEEERRAALIRAGYEPDLLPRGVSGPPREGILLYKTAKDGSAWVERLRNRICQIDGLEIDGHASSDLDPGSTKCIHCDYMGPNPDGEY